MEKEKKSLQSVFQLFEGLGLSQDELFNNSQSTEATNSLTCGSLQQEPSNEELIKM